MKDATLNFHGTVSNGLHVPLAKLLDLTENKIDLE